MTRQGFHQKDRIISPLIEQEQSPYQIITNHPELKLSVRSVYTYLDMEILTVVFSRTGPTPISSSWDCLPFEKWIPCIPPPVPPKRCLLSFLQEKNCFLHS